MIASRIDAARFLEVRNLPQVFYHESRSGCGYIRLLNNLGSGIDGEKFPILGKTIPVCVT